MAHAEISTFDYILHSDKTYKERGESNNRKSIYLLKAFNPSYENPIYKIGMSASPIERVYDGFATTPSIASQYPWPVIILAVYNPQNSLSYDFEKMLHCSFDDFRTHISGSGGSEWFKEGFLNHMEVPSKSFLDICEKLDNVPITKSKEVCYQRFFREPIVSYSDYFDRHAQCLSSERASAMVATNSLWGKMDSELIDRIMSRKESKRLENMRSFKRYAIAQRWTTQE